MSQELGMFEQRWDIGVESAYASNQAYDEIISAKARLEAANSVVKTINQFDLIDAVSIDGSLPETLAEEVGQAHRNFNLFSNVVGQMIGRDVLGADFGQTEPAEVIEQREIDEATTGKVNTLPVEMKAQVSARQFETFVNTEENIRTGKLSAEYRFPELSEFIDDILALAPTFEQIKEMGGTPALEFFERGLTEEQANATLTGLKLANDQESAGTYRTFSEDKLITPEGAAQKEVGYWGVVVIDASEKPATRGISADGKKAIAGVNAKEVIKTLKSLPGATLTKETEVIVAHVSPSEAAYRGVQRRRLERGETPLDVEGWTIGKENVNWGGGTVDSAFFRWNPGSRRVDSDGGRRGDAYGSSVVRVSGER